MVKQRRFRGFILAFSVSLVVALADHAPASDEGMAAADQVSDATYRYFLGDAFGVSGILYTHSGDDRGVGGAEHNLARDNIAAHFQSYGLTVTIEPFVYSSNTYHNVVGTKIGTVYPNAEYIVGAHYDSVSNPGADDDASGVALVLEAARIVTQYDSDYTIRFVAFSREEQGLIGSYAYVDDHATDDIRGMLQADMVAYDTGPNYARVYTDTASNPFRDALGAAIDLYGDGITWMDAGWISASDHAPFAYAGYQAGLLIEGEVWDNPYYHTQQDSVENLNNINYAYAVKMTRSAVGWLVDQAGVQVSLDRLLFDYPAGRPDFVDPNGGTTMAVAVTGAGSYTPQPGTGILHYDIGAGWQTSSMTQTAPNEYEAAFPAQTCGEAIQWYVSAEAVGSEVFTDPSSAPTGTYSATAGFGEAAFFEENMDANPGWTTEGQWAWGQPTGGGGEYGEPDPTSGYTGLNAYGYNLSGDYPNGLSETHLTTPAVDCTGRLGVHLEFWRWLGVEQPDYDHAYVRASTNGTTWTTVWENTSGVEDSDWTDVDLDISAIADDQPTVYLRWTMGSTDSGWRYCGWNIDDVQLTSLDCVGPCTADGDLDGLSGCNGNDIQLFVEGLVNQSLDWSVACHGDFAAPIGALDSADIPGMIDAMLGL